MKNSQLKNIIKESIKNLISEQTPTTTTTCYACAYEAADIADGAPYTPAATIEIQFSAASIGLTGKCAPTGMGITPVTLPNQGAGVGDYNMLASHHGIPLQGHWSTDINQTGCPTIQTPPPDPDQEGSFGTAGNYTVFDYPPAFNPSDWTANFISMIINHPNPCNFLTQRITQFNNQLTTGNVGPLQANQLMQKIAVCQELYQMVGCGGMNEQISGIERYKLDPKAAAVIKRMAPKLKGLASKKRMQELASIKSR